STTATLPLMQQFTEGTYYVLVKTNATGSLRELDTTNNVVASSALALTLPPLPDLTVTAATGPTSGVPGQQVTVSWTVQNVGAAAATAPWIDRVYLSASGSLTGATLLGSLVHTNNLGASSSYDATLTAALPALPDGSYQVIVVTDSNDTVFEPATEASNQRT